MLLSSQTNLAQLVAGIAQTDGDFTTPIPEMMIYRRSKATDPMPCIYDYGPGQSLVTSVDLPVVSYVTRANADEPYLGLRIEFDARTIAQVAAEIDFTSLPKVAPPRALSVVTLEDGLLDALVRLIRLLSEPHLVGRVIPLIQQEIIVRLLSGEHGPTLRNLVTSGSPSHQITKVIAWLKQHFTDNVPMNDLATKAHMSPSTFRQHFRSVAGMSPLQYLKNLRLQGARQLMLNEDIDASSAAVRVGYESASQFSREYNRLFGSPPQRDIKRLRESSLGQFSSD